MVQKASFNKAVGIFSKPNKPEVAQIMPGLLDWLCAHEFDVVVDPESAVHAKGAPCVSREELGARKLEFVIVLGGDGTFLAAARPRMLPETRQDGDEVGCAIHPPSEGR